ncbi:MAG: FtsX-like permease family protein [Peptostreptococcus porci]|uniref:FtsX-like permease family protein n=1 Tax=Peptostreptococcus porci TaxID=2652282 RepID=UPI002A757108|nr:FtsX-like permease family protein [Peptostreptococcus porci]MDY2794151.1 FtsX-like permease family protein [Peptostreptococcus porci]MDY5480635.1 FtsX-like permease family protein [Peptostreptococcus porci]
MKKLLKAYLKSNIKIISLVIFIMSISVAGSFAIMLSEHSEYINHYQFQKKYSSLYGCKGESITSEELKKISNTDNVKSIFYALSFENFVDENNGKITEIEGYNKSILDLNKIKLIEGKYPLNKNEALVFNINNKYKVGDVLKGDIYYKTNDNGVTNLHKKSVKIKVVGILDNKLMRYTSKDKYFVNLDSDIISEKNRLFKVFINFNSEYKNLDYETNKLIALLGINPEKLNFNRDILQTTTFISNRKLDNPRFENLVFSGIIFSTITMIIYSKKRIDDMKLLRVVGGSKNQIMLLLASEGIVIGIFALLIGTILGLLLSLFLINNANYTLASSDLFKIIPKHIHYDIYFSIYTLKIITIPVLIAFIYQLLKVNRGMAANNKSSIEKMIDRIIMVSLIKRKSVIRKVSSINLRKYIVYLIVPVILLALPISNYIYVKNAYEHSYSNASKSGISTMYANRNYSINKYDYYIPDYGFTSNDILKMSKLRSIKNLLPINSSNIIYISKGGEFSKLYNNDFNRNKEFEFSLLCFDKSYLTKNSIIYNTIKKDDSNFPKVYLKDKFYYRYNNKYDDIYTKMNAGDYITLRIPIKRGDNIKYSDIKVQVAGFVDSAKLSTYLRNRELVAGIYIEPKEYEKMYGYIRYNSISFDSDDNRKIIYENLRKLIGSEYEFNDINSERDEQNREKEIFFEIYTNLIYTGLVSVFSIFSSLKIIFLMRKNENLVMRCVGASRATVRKMYILEGLKYGLISSIITLSLTLYKILDDYLFLKKVFSNTELYINYYKLVVLSFVPFIIFFGCYFIATAEKYREFSYHK